MTVIGRHLTHLVVLVLAITIPLIGFVPVFLHGNSPKLALSVNNSEAAGPIGSVSITAAGAIVKPEILPSSLPTTHQVRTYVVQNGDTLWDIAAKFGLSVYTLIWANNLENSFNNLTPGQTLLIPPTNGVLVKVSKGETVAQLASKYNISQSTIVDYNLIKDPNNLTPSSYVMIPGAQGPSVNIAPQPTQSYDNSSSSAASGSSSGPVYGYSYSSGGSWPDPFPWGECTWWVAHLRYVPWTGNAWQWYWNAQAYGYPVGQYPEPGAIMVTWESAYGHVAYVVAVYPDGSWLVSEMNYYGFGIVDYRHIYPGQVPLIGFIYNK